MVDNSEYEYIFAEENFKNIRTLYDNGLYYQQIGEIEGALISFSSCASIIETVLNIYEGKQAAGADPGAADGAGVVEAAAATQDTTISTDSSTVKKLLGDNGGKWDDIKDCVSYECVNLIDGLKKIKQRVLGQIETLQDK